MSTTAVSSISGGCPVPSSKVTPRLCIVCEDPIPEKRLKAVPTATKCVPCKQETGDDPTYKRFDEQQGEEVVSTMFTRNKRIEAQMRRVNTLVAPDAAFESAIGDDALMERAEYEQNNENAYCMTEAFESEEDGELVVQTITIPAPITTETLDEEIELVYTPAEIIQAAHA